MKNKDYKLENNLKLIEKNNLLIQALKELREGLIQQNALLNLLNEQVQELNG
jgi:hypothetical protein